MADRPKAGWFRYVKEAFLYRWNLLLFGGAMAAAIISPAPDVIAPVVAAVELSYLAGLTTLPRFQAAIDARARKEQADGIAPPAKPPAQQQAEAKQRLLDVLNTLDPERRNRFLRLRARCVEMQRIATAVRGETSAPSAGKDLRTPSLDRLLWVFIRLLLSDQAVERFLKTSDPADLAKTRASLEEKAKAAEAKGDERMLRSVKDALDTAKLRADNYDKSKSNAEFIDLELDRIEQKIQALTEMAVSRENPDELSIQVDAVADGMQQTEQTLRDLQTITGLGNEEATPSILAGDVAEVMTK